MVSREREWFEMSRFGWKCVCWMIGCLVRLRYRVEVKGLRQIRRKTLQKPGGVLFMPNHPAVVDPLIAGQLLWPKWGVRPVVVDYMYFTPGIHFLLKNGMRAIKVPDFRVTSNSYKRARTERALQDVVDGLERGDSVLLYPAGRLQKTHREMIGGASAAYDILNRTPNANVILVRTTGLWGSSFGWGVEGKRPLLGKGLIHGMKVILKNGIFFTPKRTVTLEFEDLTGKLPLGSSKLVLNRFLEQWYNRRDIAMQTEGEPLKLVSYSRWKPEYPVVTYKEPFEEVDIESVPIEKQREVIRLIARIAKRKPSEVSPEAHLFTDLGMDSLGIAELISALDKTRAISEGTSLDLLTVGGVMALAAGQYGAEVGAEEPPPPPPPEWTSMVGRPKLEFPVDGEALTIQWAFLQSCDRMGKSAACYDELSGLLTYRDLKVRALMLARYLREFPGEHVGVMLPSSVAVEIIILAVMLAGKVPVMINWTVGARYLQAVRDICDLKVVISSWTFLDRLDGVDLTPIHDLILTVERLRVAFGLGDKLRASRLARKTALSVLTELGLEGLTADGTAVILTTSGTESLPKAVPLSHRNILSNQKAAYETIGLKGEASFLSFLPPFHSLGFSITGLIPLLIGARVVYSPDPTDSGRIVRLVERFRPTVLCSAPTFLRGILRARMPQQLSSLQLLITGAEVTPAELFEQVKALGGQARLIEGYGITECSPILTMNRAGAPHVGVGQPLKGVELRIVDPEEMTPLTPGERGLILARGPNVFSGYLGNVPTNPFVEVEGEQWYVTGDLGSIDKEGYLHLSGRMKRFVKVGGEMISLPAIEVALLEAARQGQWGGGGNKKDLAVVALEEEGSRPTLFLFATFYTDREEVNQKLSELGFSNLARVDVVQEIRQMPLMGTGKYNYRVLKHNAEELYRQQQEEVTT